MKIFSWLIFSPTLHPSLCRELRLSLFPFRRKVTILFILLIESILYARKYLLFLSSRFCLDIKGSWPSCPTHFTKCLTPIFLFDFINKGLITQVWGAITTAYLTPLPLTTTTCARLKRTDHPWQFTLPWPFPSKITGIKNHPIFSVQCLERIEGVELQEEDRMEMAEEEQNMEWVEASRPKLAGSEKRPPKTTNFLPSLTFLSLHSSMISKFFLAEYS